MQARSGVRTLAELLWQRAEDRPDALVQSFTTFEGERELRSVGLLAQRAAALGSVLAELAEPGDRVVLALAPGLAIVDALFACFAAGLVAVPVPPARAGTSEGIERLAAIIRDAEPRLVLGDRKLAALGEAHVPGPRWLDLAALTPSTTASERPRSLAGPNELALLQYTSGSTGDPRGVCLTHANVLANLAVIRDAFALEPSRVGVSWLPHFHDMGLIGTILAPVHAGFAMHRMAPESFLARPLRWFEAITEHRASVSGGPDFGFALCCQAITDAARADVDLSSWRVAFVGAEPVRAATLAAFAARFAALGFDPRAWLPCYGLAESTLFVSGVQVDARPVVTRFDARALTEGRVVALADDDRSGHALVGCGEPRAEPQLTIVGPEGRELPADQIGEIAITGASVSAGYHRRAPTEGLRTGDLGFLHAGQLYVTGRLKDLIIVRGRNLYPQDLEARAARHGPPIRPGRAAAFAIDDDRGERAVLVQEVRGECPPEGWMALAEALRVAIGESFEFELDTLALVAAGEVPLTSSGKVRRSTCRDRFVEGRLQVLALARARTAAPLELPELETLAELADAARRDAIERALVRWLEQRAGRAPIPGRPLEQLGLDSLVLVELAAELERRYGVRLGLGSLLDQDLGQLANTLANTRPSLPASTPEPPNDAAVSSGEAGLWSSSRRSPDDSADVIARAAWIEGEFDEQALARAFDSLLIDWPTLRSEFVVEGGVVIRRTSPARPGTVVIERWPDADRERLLAQLRTYAFEPMPLDRGPLIRAWVLRGSDAALLGIAVHHVLVDDATLQQLGRALGLRLAGHEPPIGSPVRSIEVARFAREQAVMLASPRAQLLRERWQIRLAELAHARNPDVGPRPAIREHRRLARGSQAKLEALAQRLEGSRFATLLALSAALLVRTGLADHERVCLATPADLRTSGGFRDAIGYLVNLLPIVVEPAARERFDRLAAQVRSALGQAIDDQELPYAQMQILQPGFEPALVLTFHAAEHSPPGFAAWAAGLADVAVELAGLRLRTAPLPARHAQFALHLAVVATDGVLELVAIADARRHDRATLAGLLESFECALEALALQPELALDELPITHDPVLALLGASGDAPSVLASIAEVAARSPDATAVVAGVRSLDYAGLLRATRSLAARLRQHAIGPEHRVGLCMPRGPELVVAILAVFEVGAAYVPLELRLPDQRLQSLAARSGCTRVLCGPAQVGIFDPSLALTIEPALLGQRAEQPSARPPVHETNLACVLFTSGSTGEPKGVAITRRGVANLLAWARADQGESLRGRVFAGTGIGFDLSLFELLGPLTQGGTVVLGADALDLPSGAGIDLLDTVPSIAAALLERGLPSDLRTINLAGEPLSWALVDALRARAPQAEIHDLYGPTETTTYSTAARVYTGPPAQRSDAPAIGTPIRATRCVLMDAQQRALPRGLIAELYIGGAGLARGYLDRPAETAARFVPDPSGTVGERVYRTGDRVRLDDDGQLHYLGRSDRQLKLAGVRIEPGEIEAVLASHPAVAQAAVQLDPIRGQLVAHVGLSVVGARERPSADQLRRFASERLPAAMVPAAIAILDALPRTPRGKLDRAALPSPALHERPDLRAPRTPLEHELSALWAKQLGVEQVGIDDDFFALGGHSLAAMILLATIQDRYAVAPSVRELYERPTIAGLAAAILAARERPLAAPSSPPIPRHHERRRWPLSPEQVRLWLADRLAPEAAAYNMPLVLRLHGAWAPERIARALAELCERYPISSTRIEQAGAALEQVVGVAPSLAILSSHETLESLAAREAARPFDLTTEPPLRVGLVALAVEQVLLFTLHHVAGDEQTLVILIESLAASLGLTTAEPSPSDALEFGDFAHWQREQLDGSAPSDRATRWSSALADLQPLELPTDRPRRMLRTGDAGLIEFELASTTLVRLDALAVELHTSRFAIVTAALGLVCARWTGQLDVPLATPISVRGLPGLARTAGLLLETSVLRVRIDRATTPRELIVQVRDEILAALERGPLPLGRIVEHDSAALLRVLVTARPELATRIGALEVHEQVRATAKAELALTTFVHAGRLLARLEYDRDLYEPSTLNSFADALARALEGFGEPDRSLSSLALAEPGVAPPIPANPGVAPPIPAFTIGVAARIIAQARRTPDRIAVAGDDFELSYRACSERALGLARWLRSCVASSGPEPRVAVCLERGVDLVPCMLAVLAAGLVHVPIDPRLPDARRRRLIERSGARVVISTSALVDTLAATLADDVELLLVDRPGAWRDATAIPPIAVAPEQLAYLIYTSGSTGEPKGVAITHRSVAARMDWAITHHRSVELEGVLAASSVAFDLSVFEIFAPLCAGGTVILARDPLALPEHRQRARVRLIDTVPSAIAALLRADGLPTSVGWINLAGEALQRELVAALHQANPDRRVVNLYGPAEDTTFSTSATIEPGSGPANLGEPLPGTRVYLLDVASKPAPRGAIGELFLAGVGLARGYDHDPSATAARFLPDPFGPPGARMYRSGDLARRASDGALHYRGRKDRQLKLRGVRIEPGEIEAMLARLEGMVEVAVVPLPNARMPERLVALCRTHPDAALDVESIRTACARELPRSHQPLPIVVEALPRTASGKLDLAAIAALAGSLHGPELAIRPPSNELEAMLRERWAELLELPPARISVDADVFSLGAHSLLIPSLLAWIQTDLGLRLPVRTAFEQTTIEALARVIAAALAERDAELLALLDEVEGMSDDEVRRLLAED